MSLTPETLAKSNASYAANFGDRGKLTIPPSKKLAVVTCMDARLNPADFFGIKDGEAHVIRNAGGLTKEAVRSVVISQRLLGTIDIAVVHHTDCGMLTFSNDGIRDRIKAAHPGDAAVAHAADTTEFLPFSDLEKSVVSDVQYLKENPLVLKDGTISGWIYEVETGKTRQIV